MNGRRHAIVLLAAVASGCTCATPPSPTLDSISPAKVSVGTPTAVSVRGSGFAPLVQADVDAPDASRISGAFALTLVRDGERVDLAGVALVSERELAATVPALPAAAVYDLELVDPRGRVAVLAAALEVEASGCGPDGTPCDDGNACTRRDTCAGGACVGSDPVTCSAVDACHEAGTCDPATGACSSPPRPDGTACDDGNACTLLDACAGGACVGSDAVTCSAVDACHEAGTCDPATGACSSPPRPDGTACDDGNACTLLDACAGGACVGSDPVTCSAVDACHEAGTCDPATGACSSPPRPDGTACEDGNACTQGDACQGGACVSGTSTCTNTAPHACLTVTPAVASVGEPFGLDPSCSYDAEDPAGALQARIDFGDGTRETTFAPATTVRQHAYPSPGPWEATVEVRDSGGISDYASRYALVAAPADVVLVTTEADEDDPGATPANPGHTGLSLREAIAYVKALGAARTIEIPAGFTIVHRSALPALSVGGAIIAGAGATLDFPRINQACVTLDGPDQLLLGVTISGCTFIGVITTWQSGGSRVAECTIGPAATATGIQAQAANDIGPRNVIAGVGTAVRLTADGSVVEENRIEANDSGVAVSGTNVTATIRRNRIVSNGTFGLQATPSFGSCTVVHNVFDANGGDGIVIANLSGGLVVRNNLFTKNGGYGIRNGSSSATLDHNGFFGNASGPISSASPGPSDLLADPLYESDHRLAPGSPAIDRGIDTGLDVNGPADGHFNGAAPDLGAWEAPYPAP